MSSDPGNTVSSEGQAASRRRWFGLFFVSLGVAMIIVDATIVNVAVPSIIKDLGITSSQAQWVQEVYTLVFAALLLVAGRVADRFGRKRLFLIGIVIFALASILAAIADSGATLIGARVLQGVGGAIMLPTSLSLINAEFRGRERGVAFAIWGSTIGGTAALGPLLGGWLTTDFSWRWAFGINIPIGIAVFIGTTLLVKESKDDHAVRGNDLLGSALSIIGISAMVFGLIEGRSFGWITTRGEVTFGSWIWPLAISPVFVAFIVGAITIAAFIMVEVRRNRSDQVVLLDLSLFSISSFRNGNIAALIVSLGEFGILFALPLWFQNVRGWSAFSTGQALLALALGSFVTSGFGGQLALKRSPAFVVRLGIVLEIVGIAGIGFAVSADEPTWPVIPLLFIYGMGVGLATAQLTGVVLADVPVAKSGQGSGTQSTSRQIGSALGIAILGTILFSGLATGLTDRLEQMPQVTAEQREQIVNTTAATAGALIPELESNPMTAPIAQAAKESFSQATRWSAFAAAGFLVIGFFASLSLGKTSLLSAAEVEAAATEAGQGEPQ